MKSYALILVALALASCRNAIYYAETDRIALAIEQKPDIAQPVSFTLGFKQRVVAVVPPLAENTAQGDVQTDAVSLLSRFEFDYENGPGLNNPTLVQSALITGRAARALDAGQSAAAMRALNTGSATVRRVAATSLSIARTQMFALRVDATLDAATKKSASEYVDRADVASVALLIGLEAFQLVRWDPVTQRLGEPTDVAAPDLATVEAKNAFAKLFEYRGNLERANDAYTAWSAAQTPPVDLAADAAPETSLPAVENSTRMQVWRHAQYLRAMLNRLDRAVAATPAYVELTDAFANFVKSGSLNTSK